MRERRNTDERRDLASRERAELGQIDEQRATDAGSDREHAQQNASDVASLGTLLVECVDLLVDARDALVEDGDQRFDLGSDLARCELQPVLLGDDDRDELTSTGDEIRTETLRALANDGDRWIGDFRPEARSSPQAPASPPMRDVTERPFTGTPILKPLFFVLSSL